MQYGKNLKTSHLFQVSSFLTSASPRFTPESFSGKLWPESWNEKAACKLRRNIVFDYCVQNIDFDPAPDLYLISQDTKQ